MSLMKVLVAGGAGYIGSHCVRQLIAAGHEPVILDNFVYGHRGSIPAGVQLREASLADTAALETLVNRDGDLTLLQIVVAGQHSGRNHLGAVFRKREKAFGSTVIDIGHSDDLLMPYLIRRGEKSEPEI